MAEETPTGAATAQNPVNMRILGQYVRDLSFENILAQKGLSGNPDPNIQVQVAIEPRKRGAENQYEVVIKLEVNSTTKDTGDKLFLLELEYGGIFQIENVPNDQMHPFLMIECPRNLFPFLRRIVSDVTRDGGFPPLNLETIDFMQLYRAELQRRIEAQKAEKEAADATKN